MYIVFSGQDVMHIDDENQEVDAGEEILLLAEATHWIENTGEEDLCFIAIVNLPLSGTGYIGVKVVENIVYIPISLDTSYKMLSM